MTRQCETLTEVLCRIDELPAPEAVALLDFVQLDPAVGASDAELAPHGGRPKVIAKLLGRLRQIASEDAAGVEHVRYRTHCRCPWCSRRRSTLLSLKGVS